MTMNLMTMKMNVSSSSTFTHFTRKYPHIINPRSMINIKHHNPANTVQLFQTHLKPSMLKLHHHRTPPLHHLHALPENNNTSSPLSSVTDKIRKFLENLKTAPATENIPANQPMHLFLFFIMRRFISNLWNKLISFILNKFFEPAAKEKQSNILFEIVKFIASTGWDLLIEILTKDLEELFPQYGFLKYPMLLLKKNKFFALLYCLPVSGINGTVFTSSVPNIQLEAMKISRRVTIVVEFISKMKRNEHLLTLMKAENMKMLKLFVLLFVVVGLVLTHYMDQN